MTLHLKQATWFSVDGDGLTPAQITSVSIKLQTIALDVCLIFV
jgi:hypothetical protein